MGLDTTFEGSFCPVHLARDEHQDVPGCGKVWRDLVFFFATAINSCFGGNMANDMESVYQERRILNEVSRHEALARGTSDLKGTALNYEAQSEKRELLRRQATGLVPVNKQTMARELQLSTRVIIDVRAALICKLGYLRNTPMNAAIADKTARKIMKDNNFRTQVIALHLSHVVDAYFNCRAVQDFAGGAHQRMPKWLLRVMGVSWDAPQVGE